METTTLSLLQTEINNRFQTKGDKMADWEAFLNYINNFNTESFQEVTKNGRPVIYCISYAAYDMHENKNLTFLIRMGYKLLKTTLLALNLIKTTF